MNYTLRKDTPSPILNALKAAANGQIPDQDELATMHEIYQTDIFPPSTSANPFDYDGVLDIRLYENPYLNPDAPGDAPGFHLSFEATYHDDGWANWSMMFFYAMLQFAAEDGYLASFQRISGDTPVLYFKDGDDCLVLTLKPQPNDLWPLKIHSQDGSRSELDKLNKNEPLAIQSINRFSFKEIAEAAENWSFE